MIMKCFLFFLILTFVAAAQTYQPAPENLKAREWFQDSRFGLFIHWGISSTKAMNISWPMIPGRALATNQWQ